MKRMIQVLACCVALGATASWAKPAAWFLWRSPSADNFICAQFAPGEEWVVMKGPFKDSLCRKPGEPS